MTRRYGTTVGAYGEVLRSLMPLNRTSGNNGYPKLFRNFCYADTVLIGQHLQNFLFSVYDVWLQIISFLLSIWFLITFFWI